MYNIDPWITVEAGPHGYPYVVLRHDNGSTATVALQGAQVTSWRDTEEGELLFMHPDNTYHPGQALRSVREGLVLFRGVLAALAAAAH